VEIFLNLAWAALAIVMVCAWLRVEDGTDRRRQFIAILVLIAILLPAISISDDLLAIQNATETDTCQRRNQLVPNGPHPPAPQTEAALPSTLYQGMVVAILGFAPPRSVFVSHVDFPGLPAVQNRPPPAA
jgi:hypothetical protein